jgi:hypothetical protein
MSTSCAGAPRGATTTSIRHRARALWLAGAMLAASSCVASLAVLPAAAQARHETGSQRAASVLTGLSSTPHTAISAFCAHFPVSTVSSIVGAKERTFEAVIENSTYECIFLGTTAAGWEVIISRRAGIPASELATLAAAEARVTAESGKGAKLIFTALPSIGKTAFSWTYAHSLNGGQLVGVADNIKTTGYGAAMGRGAKTFGTAASHVPVLERLLTLDMAA